jgi:hypothetical protein
MERNPLPGSARAVGNRSLTVIVVLSADLAKLARDLLVRAIRNQKLWETNVIAG